LLIMSWFRNLVSRGPEGPPDGPDYYQEGLELLRQEKYHEALTSFRLALRQSPNDTDVMQQIAVTHQLIGMTDEAMKTYRRVLDLKPHASGSHYGLAFLLLQRGQAEDAIAHLRAFLARPPKVAGAERHVTHARQTLAELTGEGEVLMDVPSDHG
jgi:tetratricopeptide (TPR) repeat protein